MNTNKRLSASTTPKHTVDISLEIKAETAFNILCKNHQRHIVEYFEAIVKLTVKWSILVFHLTYIGNLYLIKLPRVSNIILFLSSKLSYSLLFYLNWLLSLHLHTNRYGR
uniref:Uncharacterized protein n=1 Tax=Trichobilharzia regenti TaxID=157069 RepID=A0AA85JTF3_TRIRE|nr:unnamed protein product [Trichobilharzia regenti]